MTVRHCTIVVVVVVVYLTGKTVGVEICNYFWHSGGCHECDILPVLYDTQML